MSSTVTERIGICWGICAANLDILLHTLVVLSRIARIVLLTPGLKRTDFTSGPPSLELAFHALHAPERDLALVLGAVHSLLHRDVALVSSSLDVAGGLHGRLRGRDLLLRVRDARGSLVVRAPRLVPTWQHHGVR